MHLHRCECGALFAVIAKDRACSCPICHSIYPRDTRERIRQAYNAVDNGDIENSMAILAELRSEYGDNTHALEMEAARIEALIRRREIIGK